MSGALQDTTSVESLSSTIDAYPSGPDIDRKTLTLVLPESKPGKGNHYAVVPFPETYEDAVATATKALGRYMDNPSATIILRCSVKNRREEWVWADILPEQWRVTLERNPMEVAVFEQPVEPRAFEHGRVLFTYCFEDGLDTGWSLLNLTPKALISSPQSIDRPESFSDAVNLVLNKIQAALKKKRGHWNIFKFYTFPDNALRTWTSFPPEAYKDDKAWQAVVPRPGAILGVRISQSN